MRRIATLFGGMLALLPLNADAASKLIKISAAGRYTQYSPDRYTCRQVRPGRYQLGIINTKFIRPNRSRWTAVSLTEASKKVKSLKRRLADLTRRGAPVPEIRVAQKHVAKAKATLNKMKNYRALCLIGAEPESFVGNPLKLTRYPRGFLTDAEIDKTCDRVAYGCSAQDRAVAKQQGLEAFVDRLIGAQTSPLVTQDCKATAFRVLYRNSDGNYYLDENYVLIRKWCEILRSQAPAEQRMATFLEDIAPIALGELDIGGGLDGVHLDEWLNLLIRNARNKDYRLFLRDIMRSVAMNLWLNNATNHAGQFGIDGQVRANQNFARELMELFSLPPVDPWNRQTNFVQADIPGMTNWVSGHYFTYTELGGLAEVAYDPFELHYNPLAPAYRGPSTVFSGTPWEVTANLDPHEAIEAILAHAGAARFIVGRLYETFVRSPAPPEHIDKLAARLRSSGYNFTALWRDLLLSEAFFSKESNQDTIMTPDERLARLARMIIETKPLPPATSDEFFLMTYGMVFYSSDMGKVFFSPKRGVFGNGAVGGVRLDGEIGQGKPWATAIRTLGRANGIMRLLNDYIALGYDWRTVYPPGTTNAAQMVDAMAERFRVSLTDEQRAAIIEWASQYLGYPIDPMHADLSVLKPNGVIYLILLTLQGQYL